MSHDPEISELEIKLDASSVNKDNFIKWCKEKISNNNDYLNVTSPDIYYQEPLSDNVIRFRDDPIKPQLTVKLRKKENSIKDRLEINLNVLSKSDIINNFLKSIGYVPVLNLLKDSHIFWIDVGSNKESKITVVFYTVWQIDNGIKTKKKNFIEIESEKYDTKASAIAILSYWERLIQKEFNIEPNSIQDSLYEIYTGRRYKMVDNNGI